MKTFVIDINAFSIGINYFYKLPEPVSPDEFLNKVIKIQAREKKESISDFSKDKYKDVLKAFEQKLSNKEFRVSREEQVKVTK